MRTQNISWFALPLVFILTGCPSGDGGGGGGGEAGGSAIVYLADQTTDGVFELFLASSGAKLNPCARVRGKRDQFCADAGQDRRRVHCRPNDKRRL